MRLRLVIDDVNRQRLVGVLSVEVCYDNQEVVVRSFARSVRGQCIGVANRRRRYAVDVQCAVEANNVLADGHGETIDRHRRRSVAKVDGDRSRLDFAAIAIVIRIVVGNLAATGRQSVVRRKPLLIHRYRRCRNGRQVINRTHVDEEVAQRQRHAVSVRIRHCNKL